MIMKIGIICHPSIGGSGLVATQLGIGLADKGHEVHFISRAIPFKLSKEHKNIFFHLVEPINYPLFDNSLYTFALTSRIVEVAEKYKIDIMHAHYSIPHSLCCYLAHEIADHDFCTVTTIHGTDTKVVGQDRPLYPLNKFSLYKSDTITTVSTYQKNHTQTEFNLNKKIEVIYNFIDKNAFTPESASIEIRRTMAKDNEKIIMHISNFREPKNTNGVIKAFAKTVGRVEARLVLIGDGPKMDEIKCLCKDLDIFEKVTFMGKINHIEKIIPNADCILQPSYAESFGMVSLEAMSCEIPTVASNVDGIPEVVVHDETGYMANPDDHDSMANYLVEICTNDKLRERLGKNSRKRVSDCFSMDMQVDAYIKCYENTIKEKIENDK